MTTIGRVTHFTVRNSTLENVQANLQKMSQLQAQMSSGVKINRASDDPSGTADVLRLQNEQRQLDQYSRNASDGEAWLTTVDSAISTSLTTLNKARELVVRAGNGALGDTSRDALASELEGLRDGLLAQANTTYLGRPVFAGTVEGPAYSDDYEFADAGSGTVTRTVASDTIIRVDVRGSAVFGDGDESVFKLLDDIIAVLRGGDDPTQVPAADGRANLDAVDGFLDRMKTEIASVGARQNQITAAQDLIAERQVTAKGRLSAVQDVDLAQIILDLGAQEVAYKGALAAGAKVLQPTLLDFLR